ncbi:unnamed protein product [Brachionus calyciflorus]|uniref:HAT C-terminal dimerisation domain-containing protein n=1 Tax=Brachionus calyciflorus TaxID=104777 RepID=A0A813PK31_9BILA|nr:unnamed protein product [Brachionus calyciflorus]
MSKRKSEILRSSKRSSSAFESRSSRSENIEYHDHDQIADHEDTQEYLSNPNSQLAKTPKFSVKDHFVFKSSNGANQIYICNICKKCKHRFKNKQEIDKALIECVILDSRPFGDFSKPGIKKLLNVLIPGYSPPNRKTISKKLSIYYLKYKRKLIDIFKNISHIALTTDAWKAKNNLNYICLTAHFMDSQLNYVSLVISFRKFYGRHFSTRLKRWIKQFKKPNNTIESSNDFSKSSNSEIFEESDQSDIEGEISETKYEINDSENVEEINEEEIDNQDSEDEKDDHENCEEIIEVIDDVDNDDNEFNIQDEQFLNSVQILLSKVRETVKFIRKSNVIESFMSDKIEQAFSSKQINYNYSFVLDFHVRWNSTFLMIDRFIKLKDLVKMLTSNNSEIKGLNNSKINKIHRLELNSQEWSLINDLHKILLPFYKATQQLSKRNYPTFSSCYVVYKLLSHFLKAYDSDIETIKCLKRILQKNLEYHLNTKLSFEQRKLIKIASFLNPISNKYLNFEEKNEVEKEIVKLFPNMRRKDQTTSQNKIQVNTNKDNSNVEQNSWKSFEIACGYEEHEERPNHKNGLINLSIKDELSQFSLLVRENTDELESFWKKNMALLPKLASLVKKISIIPGSSVASESAFSVANFNERKERSSLSSRNLRFSILLREMDKIEKLVE